MMCARDIIFGGKMKKATILLGSPRSSGNTNTLTKVAISELTANGIDCELFNLYNMNIKPCTACRCCQKDHSVFGCSLADDMQPVFDSIMRGELIILSSPIYSWYCTPPMKAALDRLVYGMNKFYGDVAGPSLWEGKTAAIITTCGYRPDRGADLFEEGIKRYCKHSRLRYAGMLAERHLGYNAPFMDQDKAQRAREFAVSLCEFI